MIVNDELYDISEIFIQLQLQEIGYHQGKQCLTQQNVMTQQLQRT